MKKIIIMKYEYIHFKNYFNVIEFNRLFDSSYQKFSSILIIIQKIEIDIYDDCIF